MQAHEIVKKMKNWKLPQLMFSQIKIYNNNVSKRCENNEYYCKYS